MKKIFGYLKNAIKDVCNKILIIFDMRDYFIFGGTGLIAIGVWQIYPPAAQIVAGVIFFWLGVRKVK